MSARGQEELDVGTRFAFERLCAQKIVGTVGKPPWPNGGDKSPALQDASRVAEPATPLKNGVDETALLVVHYRLYYPL